MEIAELISFYVNYSTNTIDVKFRLTEDEESVIRVDEIDLSEAEDFGYNLILEDYDFYDEGDEDEDYDIDSNDEIDEDELITFINEYYMIYPDRLPEKDLY